MKRTGRNRWISIRFVTFILIGILFIVAVYAAPAFMSLTNAQRTSYLSEDRFPLFQYNLSANVTNPDLDPLTFEILNITTYPNMSLNFSISNYPWVSINSSSGFLSINVTNDNQSGRYNITLWVHNPSNTGSTEVFYYIVNATNDAPAITSLRAEYNFSENNPNVYTLNATDEERHYPLYFYINFTSCEMASWSNRTNCSIFSLINSPNTSATMSFTPTHNDVGVYYANLSIMDFGSNYTCSSGFCEQNYSRNRTSIYSISLNVVSSLSMDISACDNSVLQENSSFQCRINITTRRQSDNLSSQSFASLRNYVATISNTSWFSSNANFLAHYYSAFLIVNVTPTKYEIGNWTINVTVIDHTTDENQTLPIRVYINRTIHSAPLLNVIANQTIYENKSIVINATDEDLLIFDKSVYNENLVFSTNVSWISISSYRTYQNTTSALLNINFHSAPEGNSSVKIRVVDIEGKTDERNITISKYLDTAPVWNQSSYEFAYFENNHTFLNLSSFVSDFENDPISFSYSNDTAFPSFNITNGIINFTADDSDVGQHILQVSATDGKLSSSSIFNITIFNVNDLPTIYAFQVSNASKDASNNIICSEDNITSIYLTIQDNDFGIPEQFKSFYNESLNFNLSIVGHSQFFNFSEPAFLSLNRLVYTSNFIPRKSDLGIYNITINITDASNSSVYLTFNLTVISTLHPPTISFIDNQTSAVGRNFYYHITARDLEDGNSSTLNNNVTFSNSNFTFSNNFSVGHTFLNNLTFNSTSGEINITFNSSQGGSYRINISVQDSSGAIGLTDFWIKVYDYPIIILPISSQNFSLQEGNYTNITLNINHTVGDNLSFNFYLNNVFKNNYSSQSNGTNFSQPFMPAFNDETYGNYSNLTIFVFNPIYPELNTSVITNSNISHSNAPIIFSGEIPDKIAVTTQQISINLSEYFSDFDYFDPHYNQLLRFVMASNATPSLLSASVSDMIMTISSAGATSELVNITGSDLDLDNQSNSITNATSNNFLITFNSPPPVYVPVPSSGGGSGGSGSTPRLLKIITPNPVSLYKGSKVVIPIKISNLGTVNLNEISLVGQALKNNQTISDANVSLSKNFIPFLAAGVEDNVELTAQLDVEDTANYEIRITANVKSPVYSDWGIIYLTIRETNKTQVIEKIIFTEQLIASNPECIEIKEMVNEAKQYYDAGDYTSALNKVNEAIENCKVAISKQSTIAYPPKRSLNPDSTFLLYFVVCMIVAFILVYSYFTYRRFRIKTARIKIEKQYNFS